MKKALTDKKKIIKSHMETLYLLKSSANAKRLLESLEEYKKGLGQEKSLIER
ncbi:hypothetical protein [Mucilaginibacter sp.]|uniref:hypothetical protein n=1 Tax=Mucilaginibacter sp. TaxID=1882438 RepID=UPI003B002920